MPHLLDLSPQCSVRCHHGVVETVFHEHEFLATVGTGLARLVRICHKNHKANPSNTPAQVHDLLRRLSALVGSSESDDTDADTTPLTLKLFPRSNEYTPSTTFYKWNGKHSEVDLNQPNITARFGLAIVLEIECLVAVLTADILRTNPELETELLAQNDTETRKYVRTILERCIKRDWSGLLLVDFYEKGEYNEQETRPKNSHAPKRKRDVSGFRFDDLELEPGPRFESLSYAQSQRENHRLNNIHHAEREERLAEQRTTQPTVYIPNPLRRHTAEQLLAKQAKREAQNALSRQKRLKTVNLES